MSGSTARRAPLLRFVDRSQQVFEHGRLVYGKRVSKAATKTIEIFLGKQAYRHDPIAVRHDRFLHATIRWFQNVRPRGQCRSFRGKLTGCAQGFAKSRTAALRAGRSQLEIDRSAAGRRIDLQEEVIEFRAVAIDRESHPQR